MGAGTSENTLRANPASPNPKLDPARRRFTLCGMADS